MLVNVKGDILTSKLDKLGKPYIIVSQINKMGYQETMKISTEKILQPGTKFDAQVNVRCLLTNDNRAILRGWQIGNI